MCFIGHVPTSPSAIKCAGSQHFMAFPGPARPQSVLPESSCCISADPARLSAGTAVPELVGLGLKLVYFICKHIPDMPGIINIR